VHIIFVSRKEATKKCNFSDSETQKTLTLAWFRGAEKKLGKLLHSGIVISQPDEAASKMMQEKTLTSKVNVIFFSTKKCRGSKVLPCIYACDHYT
jgi:hypothetical protein